MKRPLLVSFDAAKVRILFESTKYFSKFFFEVIVTYPIYMGMKIVLLLNLLKQKCKQSAKQKYKQKPILLLVCNLFLHSCISYCMYSVNLKFSISTIAIFDTFNKSFFG